MPTPRKPQPSPGNSSRLILLLCVAALVLIGGWIWLAYSTTPTATTTASAETNMPADSSLTIVDVVDVDSVAVRAVVPAAKLTTAPKPVVTEPEPIRVAEPEPVAEEPVLKPNPVVEKPASVKCDQLVMRNGDLVDVVISEIGVQAVKYKRCNWKDSPQYTVLKADVLSIHFANGDTERF